MTMSRLTRVDSIEIRTATRSALCERMARVCMLLALIVAIVSGAAAQAPNLVGKLAVGSYHSLAVLPNGTVMAWGRNTWGQLGLGNTINQTTPQVIPGLTNVASVCAGYGHSFALLTDGTVKAWGNNSHGQLGLGTVANQTTPQLVAGLAGVVALAAGPNSETHSLALLSNGTLRSWGYGYFGQLGLGTASSHSTPQAVPGIAGAVAIGAGHLFSCALLGDGTARAWGHDAEGQLGNGPGWSSTSSPQVVQGLTGAVALETRGAHVLALRGNATMMAWGYALEGALGLGPVGNQHVPQPISGISNVTRISAGGAHSLALQLGGQVAVWGYGSDGRLGLGNYQSQNTPQLISGIPPAILVVGGGGQSFVVFEGGTVGACGYNANGELGVGNTSNQNTIQTIPGLNMLGLTSSVAASNPVGASSAWALQDHLAGAAGTVYLFEVSLTGSSPGIVIPGAGTIPLNPPLLWMDYGSALAPFLSNFIGVLDANGHAAPAVLVPHVPALMGTVLTGAAITLDATTATQIGLISNASATQLVAPVGAVTAVLPASAPHFGGTPVTILGSGFVAGATVNMGGIAATNVAVADQWTITCDAPPHAPGTGAVTVTNPGVAAGIWSGQFSWLAPTITAVAPATGGTQGGTSVGITGTVFHPSSSVTIGGVAATGVTFVSETSLVCTTPTHAPGPVSVVVSNPNGVSVTASGAFTYVYTNPAPQLTGVVPATGPIAGGTPLTITGGDFQPGATVTIGGAAAGSVVVGSASQITCTAPAGTLGPANIVVTNPDTQQATLSAGYTYIANLAVSGVTPLVAAPGATITVNGAGFDASTLLIVGGQAVTLAVVSTTQLTFAMPSGLACSTSVVLGNATGQSATINGFNPAPQITSIPFASGPAAGGSSVVVLGANFYPGTTLTIAGQPATILSLTQSSIFATAPAGSPGSVPLVITSASGCTATGTWTWN